ncbi:unnamed protein product [Adineta steineri]|uniref:Uncharacterized protein n=1 Tax=Adineta steineri TaxID=433720 RepID=A0A815JS60_9BILA|nr:unnamed protein product [Adineta steineri]
MASYFKTPFNINGHHHYIEVKVPKNETSSTNNIICCVDVSGSMSGSPIRNVCEVLLILPTKLVLAEPHVITFPRIKYGLMSAVKITSGTQNP